MITFGSLFAGIGGIDLGFEWAGLKCQWQVEKDPFCQRVLAKNFPGVERFSDVKETGKYNLKPVDIIAGGFPCQPHSLAGKRKGAADDRDLWPEYRRIVAELKPTYVIGENVPGIKTTILDDVLSDLEDLDYTCQAFVIPACAHNAPHRRDRIWIVAYAGRNRRRERAYQQESKLKCNGTPHTSVNGTEESMADADGEQRKKQRQPKPDEKKFFTAGCSGKDVAYSASLQSGQSPERERWQNIRGRSFDSGGFETERLSFAHANGERCSRPATQSKQARRQRIEGGSWWQTEPGICRVVDGFPGRVDRLKSLGNAVVPQQAYFIATLVARHYNKSL